MHSLAVLIVWTENPLLAATLSSCRSCASLKAIATAVPPHIPAPHGEITTIPVSSLWSSDALDDCLQWFYQTGANDLLVITGPQAPQLDMHGVQRMQECSTDTSAALIYGDYFDVQPDGAMHLHQLIDYQAGSIRDTFDFGPVILINGRHLKEIHATDGITPNLTFGSLYDLRLRLSEHGAIRRLPEPLYCCVNETDASGGDSHFAYVDPRNRNYQVEMEKVATAHLERIGARLDPPTGTPIPTDSAYPVKASVVIPVRNRHRTIGDAVKSALSQQTTFPYNVLVIDNHSTDGTTELLAGIARSDARLIHLVPTRTDLLIGGCWNEAIFSAQCGEYAVQLDSDDLYDGSGTLERIIDEFRKKPYALVIGSYTTVNFDLHPLPPGLIDHREWTDANGMNNALRIAGLGAPRAYHVPTLRQFGFPNVSYGEDYAVVLRLSRSYPVGRIFDSCYWCRRWDENSDSKLAPETANRYDHYKDSLRTMEISARMRKDVYR